MAHLDSDVAPRGWDGVVERLQALRRAAGNPSYQEVAQRITERRQRDGQDEFAARIAKTTIYDAMRPGRSRINVELLGEIAEALGGSPEQVVAWIRECHESPDEISDPIAHPTVAQAVALMIACLLINMMGRVMVDVLHLPIYLDMVGTAIAAIALGPWRGAAVGGVTNAVGVIGSSWVSLPFAIVNMAGALVWGYGARRWSMMSTLSRFLALNLIVALSCTLLAVPILVVVFGGSVGQGQDFITQSFLDLGNGLVAAVGLSNLLTSAGDKVLSGFVALVVISALPPAFRVGVRWIRIP